MATDAMTLQRIDHVRMFVGNARQSAYFYRNAFGFEVVAYAGLETGVRHEACYVLRQGQITFVLASPLRSALIPTPSGWCGMATASSPSRWKSTTLPAAFEAAVARGAQAGQPAAHRRGRVWRHDLAEIHAYGDTTHTLREPVALSRCLRPGIPAARCRIDTAPARSIQSA